PDAPDDGAVDVTSTLAVVELPAASLAVAVMVLRPRLRVTVVDQDPSVSTCTARPSTVRLATPTLSRAVPETVIDVAETVALSRGAPMVTVGACSASSAPCASACTALTF